MQINLKEAEIKQAIKNYIASTGVRGEVEKIDFTVTRKDGHAVEAAIEVAPNEESLLRQVGRVADPRVVASSAQVAALSEPETPAAEVPDGLASETDGEEEKESIFS